MAACSERSEKTGVWGRIPQIARSLTNRSLGPALGLSYDVLCWGTSRSEGPVGMSSYFGCSFLDPFLLSWGKLSLFSSGSSLTSEYSVCCRNLILCVSLFLYRRRIDIGVVPMLSDARIQFVVWCGPRLTLFYILGFSSFSFSINITWKLGFNVDTKIWNSAIWNSAKRM
jgi:hypothetical protein